MAEKIVSAKPSKTGVVVKLGASASHLSQKQESYPRPFNDAMQQAAAHRRRMAPVLRGK
jgi:hypothetical protein